MADARTGKNGRHALVGMLRQSVFGRLAGFEDVNDAERLLHDHAMRFRRVQYHCWVNRMSCSISAVRLNTHHVCA